MKNIVSFALYGTNMMYWKGAVENIALIDKIYPGFIARFYIDEAARADLKSMIVGSNVEVIYKKSHGGAHGMFWRFEASLDADINIFLCRDTDSRISYREAAAVDQWLSSNKDFHIMRDHKHHGTEILGGMWGSRNALMKKIKFDQLMRNWQAVQHKQDDQNLLKTIYPLIKHTAFEHSEYGISYGNHINPFPTPRINNEFVGDIIPV